MPYSRHPNVPTMRLEFVEVVMRLRSSAATFVLMVPLLLGGITKTDWEDWNHHGFNHPYHENQIIVRLEAGETVDDICDCGFFSVNTRIWLLDRKLITEEEADRFCPEVLELWSDEPTNPRLEGV